MNTVISQALATGLPVVTTRHSGLTDQVIDGWNGLLVPEADPDALARALEQTFERKKEWPKWGTNGRAHILKYYDANVLMESQIKIYESLSKEAQESKSESHAGPSQLEINEVWQKEWQDGVRMTKKELSNRLFIEAYKVFRCHLPTNFSTFLEVGTGSGRFTVAFAKEFPDAKITCTDILQASLDTAKALAEDVGVKNITTQLADVFALPFEDNSFDVVFCDAVVQHLSNSRGALMEMVRVLKPGGRLIYSNLNWWNLPHTFVKWFSGKKYRYGYEKSFTHKEMAQLAEEAGLTVIGGDGFYPGYGIYRLKRYSSVFGFLGKLTQRCCRLLDNLTRRYVSKEFGFEIVTIATKTTLRGLEHKHDS